MNEKIKELKKQAMVETVEHYCWGDPAITRHLDEEKFAELIIQECLSLCSNIASGYGLRDYENGIRAGAIECQDAIKEHFGIE